MDSLTALSFIDLHADPLSSCRKFIFQKKKKKKMNLLEANYAKMPAHVLRQFRERIFFFCLARTKHLSLGPIMTGRER